MKSNMENHTHSSREMNYVFQLVQTTRGALCKKVFCINNTFYRDFDFKFEIRTSLMADTFCKEN